MIREDGDMIMPGYFDWLTLCALAVGPASSYGIARQIEADGGDGERVSNGKVQACLKRLTSVGMVRRGNDGSYELAPDGLAALTRYQERLARLLELTDEQVARSRS